MSRIQPQTQGLTVIKYHPRQGTQRQTDIKQKEAENRRQFLRQAVTGKVAVSGNLEGLDTDEAQKRGKLQCRAYTRH